ncbi:MAG: hypothetical protein KBS80_07265 [Bacteroidales bacterium]|nr:hypothetical protein [Candidatus Cryptobacteroides choladohippi]
MKRLFTSFVALVMAAHLFAAPERDWTVYLVQHTHTDIGYTKPQTEILAEHLRYIDYAIDYCDITKDYPDDAKFRWTCESAWAVSQYLKVRPAKQVQRFKDCIKRGQIEVTAMYFNMAEVADENSMRYFLLPLKELREQGIPFQGAMQNDVNGVAWCLADYLPQAGIKFLWMGPNTDRAIEPFDLPTLFRWESPSGRSLIAFRAEHYMKADMLGILEDIPTFEPQLLSYLESLEKAGFPFSEIGMQYLGSFTDNAPPSYKVCDLIKEWNETHEYPKLRSATAHEFIDLIAEKHADELPVYRVAYPDWWTDGFGSAMRETAEARKAQADMLSNQGLLSMAEMLGADLPEGVNAGIEDIHDNLLFYDEHTFGSWDSIDNPTGYQSELQWACKGSFAWAAQKKAKLLYETSGGLLQSYIHRAEVPTITFFNPLAWERSAYCDMYVDYDLLPDNSGYRIVSEEGEEVAYQVYEKRTEGAYYRMYVKDLPSLGYRTYRIVPGEAKAAQPAQETACTSLENEYYRISIDARRGGMSSIYDKKAGREMLDPGSEWAAGQLIYETLDERWNFKEYKYEGLARSSARDVTVRAGEEGPLFRSLVVSGQADGLSEHGFSCEIKLYNDEPRIELSYAMRPLPDPEAASYYVAFPFAGDRITFDVQGGFVRPGENQLEGTASGWNTVQNFAAARSDGYQALLSSKEIPLMQLGNLLEGTYQYIKKYDKAHIFSWVLNNYWTTNFRATQGGEIHWNYTITSTPDNSDTKALRFALGDRVQPYGRAIPQGTPDSNPSEYSALSLTSDGMVITSMAPARRKGYVILQVRETAGTTPTLALSRNGKAVKFRKSDALEKPCGRRLKSLKLAPYDDIFVIVKAR